MKKNAAPAFILLTAFLTCTSARAQDDGLPPLPSRQHGENHNPKAAKWAELFRTMPDEKTSCAGLDVFYGQLAADYKIKTKDQGAAKEAGVAAIERFAENFVHLRDLPVAFEEVPELVAAARKLGAKDPILDLVEMLGYVEAGHSYLLPCFSAKNLFGMRDGVKAEYKEGLPLVMAEGMIVYCASDNPFQTWANTQSNLVNNQINPQAFIDAYAALGTAYAKGPGLQVGLLDCWLWTIHDIVDFNGFSDAGSTHSPNMFEYKNSPKMAVKHDLFWNAPWDKNAFHPDLVLALKAIQTYHAGCAAKEKKQADADQTFQANKTATIDFLAQIQFKTDTHNCLLLERIGSDENLTFPAALRMMLETGFGPRFIQAANCLRNGYHFGPFQFNDQPKKATALAWLLDEAQASERNEIAPLIVQLIGKSLENFHYPAGTENPDLQEFLAIENVWPDLDTIFTRAWASLARRPEHWAQVRARELFARHLGMAIVAKQPTRVRELLMEDAKRKAPLLDGTVAKNALGPLWQDSLDGVYAKSNPNFGAKLAALEENHDLSDEELSKQIQTLSDWEKHADDAMTKRHLQRLLAEHHWDQSGSADLPFDAVHWNMGDAKVDRNGFFRMNTGSRIIAQVPLSLSEKGAEFAFDLQCPANAPAVSFRLIGQSLFSVLLSDYNLYSFFILSGNTSSCPLVVYRIPKDGEKPGGFSTGSIVRMAKPAANKTVHVRMEYWNNYQLVWIDNHLTNCFGRLPNEVFAYQNMTGRVFLALDVDPIAASLKPEQCIGISPIHIAHLDASPRPWLPDHFESVTMGVNSKGYAAALPLDPTLEIPSPLPWAKATLLRDPGHEVALALLIKAGQGPKWETLPEAIQQRLLAACPVNPELTEYLKPHRSAPAKKPADKK